MASGGADAHDDGADAARRDERRRGATGLARTRRGQRVRRQRRLDVRGDRRRRRVDVRPRRRHRLVPHGPGPAGHGDAAPDPASIRVEEWVNAFDYDDPAPTDGPVGVTVETAAAPHTDDGTQLVRIAVDTATIADADRPPANITFVIDTSGSMDIRDRLGLVQSSLALLVQHLRDDDTIAIVTYGDEATPVLAPTKVADAERIIAAIDELGPGGSTNMEAGLLLGYEQARAAFDPAALNVVVLASDGVANVGSTDPTVLTEQITKAGEEGIHLVTVGYGMGNYNDHLMEQLADQGDGFYSYVDTFEEAERLFVDDLTPTLTVVAKDAKAQVRFDPATVAVVPAARLREPGPRRRAVPRRHRRRRRARRRARRHRAVRGRPGDRRRGAGGAADRRAAARRVVRQRSPCAGSIRRPGRRASAPSRSRSPPDRGLAVAAAGGHRRRARRGAARQHGRHRAGHHARRRRRRRRRRSPPPASPAPTSWPSSPTWPPLGD